MKIAETIVTPGLVDLHVHYREPSSNKAETIASGTRAALLGGYVLTYDMPNNPGNPTWTEEAMLEKHDIARTDAYEPIGFYAGWQPDSDIDPIELAKMSGLAAGLKLYGAPTTGNERDFEARDFLQAVKLWHLFTDKPIMFHAGKNNLRDMIKLVAGVYRHNLHICHVNSIEQVELVKRAKRNDLPVTCGVCPHHLLKTSHNSRTEGWFARVQPPLADQDEAERLLRYLADGDIDIIETDHAPHSEEAKMKAERENPGGVHEPGLSTCYGMPGIGVAAPLMFYQVERGFISFERAIDAMSTRPAEIIGVNLSSNTRVKWKMREFRIDEEESAVHSNAQWTPYLGMLAVGEPVGLKIGGKILIDCTGAIIDKWPRVVTGRGEEV